MWRISFVLAIVGLCVNTAAALPGSGTQEDPWWIESLADFDEFAADANYWAGYTRLETDLSLAGRTYSTAVIAPDTDSSTGWFQGTAFTGVFYGNDHKITNLTIDDAGAGNWYMGLFGYIGPDGEVRNLGVEGASISGEDNVGGLVGSNAYGSISNCYSTGDVSGSGLYVGGLVGGNQGGTVSNCYSTGDVDGVEDVGGLVGYNRGSVSNCYSTGRVSGHWDVGGLVGNNDGSVSNCYSTGDVSGNDEVGGLVGINWDGSVLSCFWDTDNQTHGVTESIGYNEGTATNVAGLPTAQMQTKNTFTDAGWDFVEIWAIEDKQTYPFLRLLASLPGSGTQQDPYRIESLADFDVFAAIANYWDAYTRLETDLSLAGRTYSTAVIAPDTDSSTPWFQGTAFTGVFDGNGHKITNLTIDDGGAGNDYLGLFGCIVGGEVKNLGLEGGSVSGDQFLGGLGGLVGKNRGSVSNCYSTGSVSGGDEVGGLVGSNDGSVSNSYSTGSVSGDRDLGGLVGENFGGIVSNCYSTGDVTDGHTVGGLVGQNWGSVSNCYCTGNVSAGHDVGGLVGENISGGVSNCYSTGDVSGWDNVGGLVGYNYYASLSSCYSTGDVSGIDIYDVGGLVGENYYDSSISNCFWDTDTQTHGVTESIGNNQGTATNVVGLPTAQMQTKSTFTAAGWDFLEIWLINEGATYPVLRQEIHSDLNGDGAVDLLDFAIFADHWLEGKGH